MKGLGGHVGNHGCAANRAGSSRRAFRAKEHILRYVRHLAHTFRSVQAIDTTIDYLG